jgi:hypothetical protein
VEDATTQGQFWVAVCSLLGSAMGTAVMLYTQARNRRWAKEDAKELAQLTAESHRVLAEKIDDNTSLTAWAADKAAMAINEANNFERKWQVIEKMFMASAPQADEVRAAVLETKHTVEATHEIVARELDHHGDDRG